MSRSADASHATMVVWRREGKGGKSHMYLGGIDGHCRPMRCLAVGGGEAGEVDAWST